VDRIVWEAAVVVAVVGKEGGAYVLWRVDGACALERVGVGGVCCADSIH